MDPNTYSYVSGYLTSVAHNDFDITYDYDNRGRVSKIMVAGSDYLDFVYNEEGTNSISTAIYANGKSFKTETDKNGNVTQILYAKDNVSIFEPIIENIYDTHGNLIAINDKINTTTIEYTLDKFGNTILQTDTQHGISVQKENTFDNTNNNTNTKYTIGENIQNYTFNYDTTKPESILNSVVLPTNAVQSIKNDNLDRTKEIVLNNIVDNETKTNTRLFHYLKNGDHTSNLVSSIWFGDSDKYLDNLKYKYDEKGNITEVYENSMLVARYKYDSLSRLIREDNKPLNKTTTWEYDAGGNILNRFEYEFTTINDLNEKTPTIIPYAYVTSGIRDRLMSYNGEQFVYDSIGNPTLYQNNVLVWEKGRQLKSYGDIASYTYNASGIRTGKTVGTTTTQFFLDGTKILAQKDIVSAGENTTTETLMQFIYGVDGIIGFTINNENYYYKKNLQGDIIGIYDNNLQLITKYTYDAWGNHKISYLDNDIFVDFSPTNSYNETNTSLYIALKNPFRYRGYYYDTETGLYYLNSRYYDPETGRFINVDDIDVIDTTKDFANGINLYVYCLNNPVNDYDINGNLSWSEFWKGLGRIITGIFAVVVAVAVIVSSVATFGALAIAGITLLAGTITLVNGIADVGESFSGYNFMRDGVFGGNQTAYGWFSGVFETVAIIGSAISGSWLSVNAPRIKAYKNIGDYKFSQTLSDATHMSRPWQNSIIMQKQVIKYGQMIRETSGVYKFVINGSLNNKDVIWKLVVNNINKTIFHWGPF